MACQCRARNTEQFCLPPVGSDLLAHKRDFQANSSQVQIADSSSTNAVSFSSARTTKRFPSPRCASALQIVRWNQSLRRSPTPIDVAQIVSDYFPILHAHVNAVNGIWKSTDKPGHREFIYPVIAAVTGPVLTFAPPAFFDT
jgi:hypothetical protein